MNLHLQLIRKRVVKSAKECIREHKTNSEVYGKMQDVIVEMDTDPTVCSEFFPQQIKLKQKKILK